MTSFRRGLSDNFIGALERLAGNDSWWRDVLRDTNLLIAVRNEYLNIYWQGQSIFKVDCHGEHLTARTHPKYLVNPELFELVSLDVDNATFGELPEHALIRHYNGPDTLQKMKSAAGLFSGDEKKGVQVIARGNKDVVDVEIAFDKHAVRLDIADFNRKSGEVDLGFWEAKLFTNKELRAKAGDSPVVRQIEKYKVILNKYRDDVLASHKRVASNLVSIANMSCGVRSVGPAILSVAEGAPLAMATPPHVGLILYGFHADQWDGAIWKPHLDKLRSAVGINSILHRGEAKGLIL